MSISRTSWRPLWVAVASVLLVVSAPPSADAHAIAGQRLFPSTLTFDDPGIGAELPMTFSHVGSDDGSQNDFGISVTKPVTQNFSITASTDYLGVNSSGSPTQHGWGNVSFGGAWQAYNNPKTESLGSLTLSRRFANTGSQALRDDFSTWSPEFNFGQGLGNASAQWLRPFAITGGVGFDLPDMSSQPRTLNLNLSLQYSIPYLQNFVKYAGFKAPFDRMIPIVELSTQTCLDQGCHGQVTGYLSPGVIWVGKYFQLGAELMVPLNRRTGHSVGFMVGLDFYLDDLAPHGFGAPMFH
ncbi:MAG: hypothetical protein EPN34_07435 [Burkholderiaceae bacterium]|nr:MAG: hypothetical protein EPN34_07435 [Burkholderiaceae bacterium]